MEILAIFNEKKKHNNTIFCAYNEKMRQKKIVIDVKPFALIENSSDNNNKKIIIIIKCVCYNGKKNGAQMT